MIVSPGNHLTSVKGSFVRIGGGKFIKEGCHFVIVQVELLIGDEVSNLEIDQDSIFQLGSIADSLFAKIH